MELSNDILVLKDLVMVLLGSLILAYASLKLFDIPLRAWLGKRFVSGRKKVDPS